MVVHITPCPNIRQNYNRYEVLETIKSKVLPAAMRLKTITVSAMYLQKIINLDECYAGIIIIVWNMSYKQMGVSPLMLEIGPVWPWSSGSWMHDYLCNQCLSPLTLWVRIPLMRCVPDTTLCDKVCQLLATGQWFSLGIPVSSTNKSYRHDVTEILLKVALIIIVYSWIWCWITNIYRTI